MELMGSVVQLMSPHKTAILFVCMGNICRSPVLAAMLQKMADQQAIADQLYIDSCALTPWYVGKPTDPRMVTAAVGKGLILDHRARMLSDEDFSLFNWMFAVDREVFSSLEESAKEHNYKGKIALATAYSKRFSGQSIVDPYYGGSEGFLRTIEIAADCCKGILDVLIEQDISSK